MKYLLCAGYKENPYCDMRVEYHPQDLEKARKLFREQPIKGASGSGWKLPYKTCYSCKWG